MRWLIGAAALAVLAVLAILLWMADAGSTRHAGGRDAVRPPRGGGIDGPAPLPAAPPAHTFRVTLALERPDGTPAAGARIALAGAHPIDDAQADAQGRWSADALPPGPYRLRAATERAAGALAFALAADLDLGTLRLDPTATWAGRVLAADGTPVDDARVEAADDDDLLLAVATSGDDGRFALAVPAGRGTVTLRASHSVRGLAVRPDLARDAAHGEIVLYLSPGGTVRGVVVDEAGRAVDGAQVTLDCHERRATREPLRIEAFTDARGAFALPAAGAWRYVLSVRATGFAAWRDAAIEDPAQPLRVVLRPGATLTLRAVDADARGVPVPGAECITQHGGGTTTALTDADGRARLVDLPPGEPVRVTVRADGFVTGYADTRLPEDAGDLGEIALARGGTVTGTVRARPDGVPVPGAVVRAFGGGRSGTRGPDSVPAATSDASGRFELRGVPLDAHALVAQADGYLSPLLARELRRSGVAGTASLFADGTTYAEHDVELAPATTLRGVVFFPDGGPADGARVVRMPAESTVEQLLGSWRAEAWCDERGRFSIESVDPEGSERLVALHPAHACSDVVATVPGDAVVELRLRAASRATGRVVDEGGAPLADCLVQVQGGGVGAWVGLPSPVRSGADGRFALRGLPPVALTLTFSDAGRRVVHRALTLPAAGGPVDLGDVVLARAQGLSGIVVDEEGRPCPGVTVTAAFESGNTPRDPEQGEGRTFGQGESDAAGRFTIEGLRAGRYRLRAVVGGRVSDRPLVPTGTRDARLTLEAAATLDGRVTSGGRPVEGALVRALLPEAGAALLDAARTDAEGRFRLRGVPSSATFTIEVSDRGLLDRRLEGVRASDSPLTIVLEAGARVGGRVVDEQDAPVPDAPVSLWVDGKSAGWVRTDAEGRFLASGIAAGRLELQVQATRAGHLRSERVEVPAETLDLELRVETGARIAGRVVDARGRPRSGLRVTAYDDAGRPVASTWVWDPAGTFELLGVRKGSYVVAAIRADAAAGDPPAARAAGVATGTADLVLTAEE